MSSSKIVLCSPVSCLLACHLLHPHPSKQHIRTKQVVALCEVLPQPSNAAASDDFCGRSSRIATPATIPPCPGLSDAPAVSRAAGCARSCRQAGHYKQHQARVHQHHHGRATPAAPCHHPYVATACKGRAQMHSPLSFSNDASTATATAQALVNAAQAPGATVDRRGCRALVQAIQPV